MPRPDTFDRVRWLKTYGPATLRAWDFRVGVLCGAVAFLLGTAADVRAQAPTVFIAEAALGAAFMATVFTVLAMFATFLDGAYRRILDAASGFRDELMGYYVVAAVGGLTAGVSTLAVIAEPILGQWSGAAALGASTFLCTWAIAGVVDLTAHTLFHAVQRAQLMSGADDAAAIRVHRQKESPPPS